MKVCFFGSYVKDSLGIPSGNGGTLLKKILELQNVEVIECHETIKGVFSFIPAYLKLLFKHRKLKYDIMVIPWRGILTLPLAKLIHKKPIIYFPAFSIYDTLVNDRKKIKPQSLKAKFVHFIDKLASNWSDKVILESSEEINYFIREFNLQKDKFSRLPLPADESIFFPQSENEKLNEFRVLYFGSFIPLHGIETIIETAILLQKYKEISFIFCGDGQRRTIIEKIIEKNNLKNVHLLGIVSKEDLINNIKKSDVCLGIFGSTIKAQKVLTNKVAQILASKKPLITMESPTAKESNLKNEENCILIPPACPKKLEEAILFLKNNSKQREQIALIGYQTYQENLSMNVVGKKLIFIIKEILKNSD